MPDITDQDRRNMLEWARIAIASKDNHEHAPWVTAARYILDNVDAPATTLAEELREVGARYKSNIMYDVPKALAALATRAEQMEQERDEARAEVERLTAVNDELRRTDNFVEFLNKLLTAQKGAESNAETPDPADVKPGEVWKANIWYDDVPYSGTAIKSSGGDWTVTRDDGSRTTYRMNEYVELVSRLVPAPRVITNPDELDRLAEGSIVRDRAGHAWERYPDEDWYSTEELDDGFSSHRLADYAGPVTVLWEPAI